MNIYNPRELARIKLSKSHWTDVRFDPKKNDLFYVLNNNAIHSNYQVKYDRKQMLNIISKILTRPFKFSESCIYL